MMVIYEALLTHLRYTDVDGGQDNSSYSSWEAVIRGFCMFHLCGLELTVRKVADVPCGGRRGLLLLTVRKYICHTGDCPRSIFTEWLPELVQSYARMTNQLRQWIEAIGRATSGEVGAWLAEHLGVCISPNIPYITKCWNQGEHNGHTLFRELQMQGYKGGSRTVYRFLETLRGYIASSEGRAKHTQTLPDSPLQQFASQQAVWLFVRDCSDLDETERAELAAIRQASPTVNTVYELAQDFMHILRHREDERLDA